MKLLLIQAIKLLMGNTKMMILGIRTFILKEDHLYYVKGRIFKYFFILYYINLGFGPISKPPSKELEIKFIIFYIIIKYYKNKN